MNEFLAYVVEAHGGMHRWRGFATITTHLSAGGPFRGLKGWPDLLSNVTLAVTLALDTRREHVATSPSSRPIRPPRSTSAPSDSRSGRRAGA